MLKTYLVARDKAYPLTHDLLLILEHIIPVEPQAETLRPVLALLNPYSVAIRYPDSDFIPSLEDAEEAKSAAEEILSWLRVTCPDLCVT